MRAGRTMTGAATLSDIPVSRHDISPEITAYFTSRGDVTDSPYSGFNICHYTGDDPDRVARCRESLSRYVGVSPGMLIVPRPTHSVNCQVIDSVPVSAESLEGVDALVTPLPGVAIGVSTADCVPVLLADPAAGIIGAAHAGWRGAIGGVVEVAVNAMVSLGAMPGCIKALMGPCICKDCFEVGDEVASLFPEEYVVRVEGCKPHVDLLEYVASRLVACGIPCKAVTMPPACTRCNPDHYFSARRLGVNSGRNFSMICRTVDKLSRN